MPSSHSMRRHCRLRRDGIEQLFGFFPGLYDNDIFVALDCGFVYGPLGCFVFEDEFPERNEFAKFFAAGPESFHRPF